MEPTCVSFRLSPRYGIHTARDAHDWFLAMMREHEEFEVETDQPGEWPMPFWSKTVKWFESGVGPAVPPTYSALRCYVVRRILPKPD